MIPPHPLTNFEIQKYYKNEPRFNGVYSRDNLPKIKDGAYVINLDEYSDIGTHWVVLYLNNNNDNNNNNNNIIYFDSLCVEHIPKKLKHLLTMRTLKQYFQNTSVSFDNMWIFLYWFY